ncbi:DUF3015 domain-containing protein [Psychromonas sp. MB-3u-54]|uniref:DUF3015 family protein n=1 Tax=Psychromonas sp. MB-3u-54 TaxID=2058319 RepID=UPI000C329D1D|nr:DUF3015 family protein [Psychromonas sp. MB-3u-54]PKH01384.1 DUF3015 domain-containing protein [Psychromonas sp. MB-3u-54]
MNKLILVAAIASSIIISPVTLAAKGTAQSGINPWTECGIGAMIFQDTAPAAAISNVIWDFGTTAVTSAGISQQTCEGNNVKTAMFIQQSYNNIIEETAKGSGEHITAMLDILEVNQTDRLKIMANVRAEMAEIVGQSAYTNATMIEKSKIYYNSLILNATA